MAVLLKKNYGKKVGCSFVFNQDLLSYEAILN